MRGSVRSLLCGWFVVLALVCLFIPDLGAQVRYRPDEPGPWRPWHFTATSNARQEQGAAVADVRAFEAKLLELTAIAKRSPAVAMPIGFAAEFWGALAGYRRTPAPGEPEGKSLPLAGGPTFGAFPLIEFTRNGRLMNEDLKGGETQLLIFLVNQIDRGTFGGSRPVEWAGEDVPGFLEPPVDAPIAGLPRFGEALVLTNRTQPFWVPVSLAEALRPVIRVRKAQFENTRDVYANQVAEFADWQTPAKRAARRTARQEAAKMLMDDPTFLATAEKSEVQFEQQRRADLAPGGLEDSRVKEDERQLRDAESALAALSPADQTLPACWVRNAASVAQAFRPLTGSSSPACQAIVKTNWDFFDPKLPRSVPQVLIVSSYMRCLTPESLAETRPGGCATNRKLMETLDWEAVKRWLSPR